ARSVSVPSATIASISAEWRSLAVNTCSVPRGMSVVSPRTRVQPKVMLALLFGHPAGRAPSPEGRSHVLSRIVLASERPGSVVGGSSSDPVTNGKALPRCERLRSQKQATEQHPAPRVRQGEGREPWRNGHAGPAPAGPGNAAAACRGAAGPRRDGDR